MAYESPFVAPTLTGYNASPPSDDGQRTAGNAVRWSTHKTKLGDPLRDYSDALKTAIIEAFDAIPASINLPDWRVGPDDENGVTIVNHVYERGYLYRYGTNTTPGTTDMTEALRAACDSGHKVVIPGEVVALDATSATDIYDAPTSIHTVDKHLVLLTSSHDGLRMRGEPGAELKVIGTASGRDSPYLFFIQDGKNMRFEGITFNGNCADTGTFTSNPRVIERGFCAFYLFSSSADGDVANITWRDCTFKEWNSAGIYTHGHLTHPLATHFTKDNLRVDHCLFDTLGDHGVAWLQAKDSTVSNCRFVQCGLNVMPDTVSGGGLAIDFSAGCIACVAVNCVADGCSGGFKSESHDVGGVSEFSEDCHFVNCTVRNCQTGTNHEVWYGIKLGGKYCSAVNCLIEDTPGYGILSDIDGCRVVDCRVIGTNSAYHGIYLSGGNASHTTPHQAGHHLVTGNYVEGFAGWGILCLASSSDVTHNWVTDNDAGGLALRDPNAESWTLTNVNASFNRVYNNTGVGLLVQQIANGIEISKVTLVGNQVYDTRSGGSRTQTYGIYVPGYDAATTNTFDVVEAANQAYNNVTADWAVGTNVVSIGANGRKETRASAAPAVGTWAVGDTVWNSAPAAGGTMGWIYTASGWKEFGAISA